MFTRIEITPWSYLNNLSEDIQILFIESHIYIYNLYNKQNIWYTVFILLIFYVLQCFILCFQGVTSILELYIYNLYKEFILLVLYNLQCFSSCINFNYINCLYMFTRIDIAPWSHLNNLLEDYLNNLSKILESLILITYIMNKYMIYNILFNL